MKVFVATLLLLVPLLSDAGVAKKLKMKRYDKCIGFDSLESGQEAKLFDCNDSRVRTFTHSINTLRLTVAGTNFCLDDWSDDWEIRINTCSGADNQEDQKWIPLYAGGGYAFFNLANECLIDDWGNANVECEPNFNSLNKGDFADSQIFTGLGKDFID